MTQGVRWQCHQFGWEIHTQNVCQVSRPYSDQWWQLDLLSSRSRSLFAGRVSSTDNWQRCHCQHWDWAKNWVRWHFWVQWIDGHVGQIDLQRFQTAIWPWTGSSIVHDWQRNPWCFWNWSLLWPEELWLPWYFVCFASSHGRSRVEADLEQCWMKWPKTQLTHVALGFMKARKRSTRL